VLFGADQSGCGSVLPDAQRRSGRLVRAKSRWGCTNEALDRPFGVGALLDGDDDGV